jgi:hypothetical protein
VLLAGIGIVGWGQSWFSPKQDAKQNLRPANSSASGQGEAEVWRGNAALVEFAGLISDADWLEQSLKTRGDAPAAPSEWEQVGRRIKSLEKEVGDNESGW